MQSPDEGQVKPEPVKPKTISLESLNAVATIRDKKNGNTELHKAILNNQIMLAIDLATIVGIVNIRNNEELTPLHLAATKDVRILAALLGNRAHANLQTPGGDTALHLSIRAQNKENVSSLLNHTNITLQNFEKKRDKKHSQPGLNNPLHTAFYVPNCNVEIIENVIKAASDRPIQLNKGTLASPIHPLNAPNQDGVTPLYLAYRYQPIQSFNKGTIDILIKEGDFSARTHKGQTVFHAAAKNKLLHIDTFNVLLVECEKHLLLNQLNKKGHTPLYYAAKNNDEAKVVALLNKGAMLDIDNTTLPLHVACQLPSPAIALHLIAKDANVNAIDKATKKRAFQYAVENNHPEILKALKAKKVEVTADMLQEAVQYAIINNKRHALLVLLTHFNADPSLQIKLPKTSSVSSLSSSIAAPSTNRALHDGDTALHYAVKNSDDELAAACFANKSDSDKEKLLQTLNSRDKSAAYYAIRVLKPHNTQVPHILYQNGARDVIAKPFLGLGFIETKGRTFLHAMNKRGFNSRQELVSFFSNPNHELNADQNKMQAEVSAKYQAKK